MYLVTFPGVSQSVVFRFWKKDIPQSIIKEIAQVKEQLKKIVPAHHQETLQESARKHSFDAESFYAYLAGNVVYNWWTDTYPFWELWDPEIIVPIGSRSEKIFFETLLQTNQSLRRIIPIYVQNWRFPVYYPHSSGDIFTVEEYDSKWTDWFHPDVIKDIDLVYKYIGIWRKN